MQYQVKIEITENVEADSIEEAKDKFKNNFMFSDLDYGTWVIEKDKEVN
tara:strand:+ start:272 stop:418 length:147 start_codon:yes stop_codon:yes gene_type:complete